MTKKIVLTVHDEVVACVPEETTEDTVALITRVMSRPPVWAPGLPVACEVSFGKTYGEAK